MSKPSIARKKPQGIVTKQVSPARSPISCLPAELLYQIFELVRQAKTKTPTIEQKYIKDGKTHTISHARNNLYSLSRVCWYWNQIATQFLYKNVNLTVDPAIPLRKNKLERPVLFYRTVSESQELAVVVRSLILGGVLYKFGAGISPSGPSGPSVDALVDIIDICKNLAHVYIFHQRFDQLDAAILLVALSEVATLQTFCYQYEYKSSYAHYEYEGPDFGLDPRQLQDMMGHWPQIKNVIVTLEHPIYGDANKFKADMSTLLEYAEKRSCHISYNICDEFLY